MRKQLAITAFIFFSLQSSAGHFETLGNYGYRTSTSILSTELVESKEAAYQEGHNIMSGLGNQQSYDLSRTLRVPPSRLDVRSIRIDNSYVTVQETSRIPGQIEYQGLVIVNYHYRVRESRN